MRPRLLPLALLAATAWTSPGCVYFGTGGFFGMLCVGGAPLGARGIGGPCACAILCEASASGVVGRCYVGEAVFEVCYDGPLSVGANGRSSRGAFDPSYSALGAYFALGSYETGASTSHQVGDGVAAGVFETFSATVTYPPEFAFDGFGTSVVGKLAIDFDLDGASDAAVPLIGAGADLAFADLDFNGLQMPGVEPTVTHSGTHVFTLAMPAGGDRNTQTVQTLVPIGLMLTLFPGVMRNPETPGEYFIDAAFTSVDPETDGADDSTGPPPRGFTTGASVQIGDGPCPAAPAPGCNASFEKASLALKASDSGKQSFRVKGKKGVTAPGFFGDPTDETSHATCVYDGGGLVLELPIAAGGTGANGKPLWKLRNDKTSYKDKSGAAGGVQKVGQRSGRQGAGFDVSARGAALGLPALPLVAPVTVQHRTVDGGCAEVVFDALSRNDAGQVKASLR